MILYWTQHRYIEEIKQNGFTRESSSGFLVSNNQRGNIWFTKMVCLYHAIWLEVQCIMRNEWRDSFWDFYQANPDMVPTIVVLEDPDISMMGWWHQKRYVDTFDLSRITYPYLPLNNSKAFWIRSIISYTLENILFAENWLSKLTKSWNNSRFFQKDSTKAKQADSEKITIVDGAYLKKFLENLSNIPKSYE